MLLQETHFIGPKRLKVKGYKKIVYANSIQKRACVAILLSDNIGFKSKKDMRQRRRLYIDKGFNPTGIYNNYTYINLKTELQNIWSKKIYRIERRNRQFWIILGDFNTQPSIMGRTTRLNINKEIAYLNNTLNSVRLQTYKKHFRRIHIGRGVRGSYTNFLPGPIWNYK